MLELYQFEFSHYSEKIRLILDYKELDYKKINVTPGVGQVEVFKISGQKQVPVLKDGDTVIADSTKIALYLEEKYPEKPILPSDPVAKGQCLLLEELADEVLGKKARIAFFNAINQYQNFRTSLLPSNTPDIVKNLVGVLPGIPSDFFNAVGSAVGLETAKDAIDSLKSDLDAFVLILSNRPYLVTDSPTLADFAVASLSVLLKFPQGDYFELPTDCKGQGIPGIADNSSYEAFFTWRDRLYANYRKASVFSGPPKNSSPTSIEIE